ncbi:MAG: Smr/MutS family protein [Phenylobacterium sp.]|uniref:Smr/MutS family protein n=1 Tax=Phenylobacterium sp. TaxID=1871053 RepID=UPI0025EDF006|nr:Smr/MutS family protein [Phenylobacterium sp.]MCG9915277.1 Smr/MutS family protein [Phenylobacterium sp.]
MKRPLRPEEHRLWSVVAATLHPLPGRHTAVAPPEGETAAPVAPPPAKAPGLKPPPGKMPPKTKAPGPAPAAPPRPAASWPGPDLIEPNRHHRIVRERDPIAARLDLHGLTYDAARATLDAFLLRAWDEGHRAVLVITGKGSRGTGDGALRRATPEWLAAAHLRSIVAGVSEAHRRHGGGGALYVALKRKPRG